MKTHLNFITAFVFSIETKMLLTFCVSPIPPPTPTARPVELEVVTEAPPTATPEPIATPEPTATAEPTDIPLIETGLPIAPYAVGSTPVITKLHMIDRGVGWAIAIDMIGHDEHILYTTNGALSWQDITPAEPQSTYLTSHKDVIGYFSGPRDAWIVYDWDTSRDSFNRSTVWITHNAGKSWTPSSRINSSGLKYFMPFAINFVDKTDGWLLVNTGSNGIDETFVLYGTQDGGANWTRLTDSSSNLLPPGALKTGLLFSSRLVGWLSIDDPGYSPNLPYLFQTVDGGLHWKLYSLPAPTGLPTFFAANPCLSIVSAPALSSSVDVLVDCEKVSTSADKFKLYRTADQGNTWTIHDLPSPYGDLSFLDSNYGWLLGRGSDPDAYPRQIYQTQDGGKTWTLIKSVNWSGTLDFVDNQNGWVASIRSPIYDAVVHTTNGGAGWSILPVTITK